MSALRHTASLLLFATSFAPVVYPKVDSLQVRGNTVVLSLDSVSGCVFSSAFLSASEDTSHMPGNPKGFSGNFNVFLFFFNACTGESFDASGFGPLTVSAFQVSPNLSTATLNVNTIAVDSLGNPVDVAIALTWTATEGVFSGNSISRSRLPGVTTFFRSNGSTRLAQATGTLSAFGINFALLPNSVASISKLNTGSVTITH
jgi:hypothetical protein